MLSLVSTRRLRRIEERLIAAEDAIAKLAPAIAQLMEHFELTEHSSEPNASELCEDCEAVRADAPGWLFPCPKHTVGH